MNTEPGKAKTDATSLLTCPVCGAECHPLKDTPLLALDLELVKHGADPFKREPGWSLELARQGHFQWACKRCIQSSRAIKARPWLQTWDGFDPIYAFADQNLKCAGCDRDFSFTAGDQQFWYEEKAWSISNYPKQCLSCRRKKRRREKKTR